MAGLGDLLEQTRRSRGITLDEAERATHIARRFLEALEQEDFSVFSSPVFARGFLRNYSAYLGLDPNEVLAYWPQGQAAPSPGEEPPPETARDEFEQRVRPLRDRARPRYGSRGPAQEMPGPLTRRLQPRLQPSSSSRVGLLAAALIVVCAILLFVVSRAVGGTPATGTAVGSQASNGSQPAVTQPPARAAGKMPDLVGNSLAEALSKLQGVGITPLVIGIISTNRNQPPNTVVQQQPSAGTSITTNSNVTLTVSVSPSPSATTPPATVPARPTPIGTPRG